jgi:hypothetical protein
MFTCCTILLCYFPYAKANNTIDYETYKMLGWGVFAFSTISALSEILSVVSKKLVSNFGGRVKGLFKKKRKTI